jgi:phospholipid-binding lipoprotein MlaA
MHISPRTIRALLLGAVALAAVGCSTAPVQKGPVVEPLFPADRVLTEGVKYAGDVYDPWEGFNRTMYRFNYHFDKYVFLPVTNAYKAILPDFAEKGIHNFFSNIRNVRTLINSILQLNADKAAATTARLVLNTTFGIVGVFDVATGLDVPYPQEDFGQTLGYWGVASGPYLVLPILGPSSVRDGVGVGVDAFVASEIRDRALDLDTWQKLLWWGLDAVDTRANIPFRYYETGTPFEYDMVRWLYTTKRQIEIAK